MAHAMGLRVAMALEAASQPGVRQGPIIAGSVAAMALLSWVTVRSVYKDSAFAGAVGGIAGVV